MPFEDLGFAKVDHHRELLGIPGQGEKDSGVKTNRIPG
jgi:hypothetical protein